MKFTTYLNDLRSINMLLDIGFDKIIIEEPAFSLFSKKTFNTKPNYNYILAALQKIKNAKSTTKVVFNIDLIPHNKDLDNISTLIHTIKNKGFDAIRIQDIGLALFISKIDPNIHIEINSVTGNYNYAAILALEKNIKNLTSITLSKEIGYKDIKLINSLSKLDNELLIHGHMLLFYTKRNLIAQNKPIFEKIQKQQIQKQYLTKKDKDNIMLYLQEQKRIGKYFPLLTNKHGSFLFLPEVLSLACHTNLIHEIGLKYFLFDFRYNTNYKTVRGVMNLYKKAFDDFNNKNIIKHNYQTYYNEIAKYYKQGLTEGFFIQGQYAYEKTITKNKSQNQNKDKNKPTQNMIKVAFVLGVVKEKLIAVKTFDSFEYEDLLYIITPENKTIKYSLKAITTLDNNKLDKAIKNKILLLNWAKNVIPKSILYKHIKNT